jgi:hypothetical protein
MSDDNTMMYVALAAACCCSSSSSGAAAFFLMRKKKPATSPRKSRRRRRCFAPETVIKLQNGESRKIHELELGDVLVNGSVVDATMKIKNQDDPYYKLPGDILVTGSHYVKDGDTFKQVKNLPDAEATTQVDSVVYCLVTSDHKIPVGDYVFWDWEDNLVVQ